ncbi:MAG: hypothetical protein ACRDWD_04560 [Acidimicrobiia bacterium]
MTATRKPHFNHVAMSMPADALDERGRTDILRFYNEVFGWEELPMLTEDRRRLVMSAYTYEQFVFLIAEDEPMQCPRLDHFGMSVSTRDEFDDLYEKARAFRGRDERVDLIDPKTDEYPMLKLTSFYARYLLPMMVEVQHYDWQRE